MTIPALWEAERGKEGGCPRCSHVLESRNGEPRACCPGMRLRVGDLGQAVLLLLVWSHPVPHAEPVFCPPSYEEREQRG